MCKRWNHPRILIVQSRAGVDQGPGIEHRRHIAHRARDRDHPGRGGWRPGAVVLRAADAATAAPVPRSGDAVGRWSCATATPSGSPPPAGGCCSPRPCPRPAVGDDTRLLDRALGGVASTPRRLDAAGRGMTLEEFGSSRSSGAGAACWPAWASRCSAWPATARSRRAVSGLDFEQMTYPQARRGHGFHQRSAATACRGVALAPSPRAPDTRRAYSRNLSCRLRTVAAYMHAGRTHW